MKLIWNDLEMAWICSECGANYGPEEVARAFSYQEQIPQNFYECYCMDCGCPLTDVEI